MTRFLLLIIALNAFILKSSATHIIGGQIHHRFIDNKKVEFTFIGYRDINGVTFANGLFDFGDGHTFGNDEEIPWEEIITLENGIEVWKFTLTHEYEATGLLTVSYSEDFRSGDVKNVSSSISTSFYVESMVMIDPLVANTSPSFTKHPEFKAAAGSRFITNFSREDADGDSLSYRIARPLQSASLEIDGYVLPVTQEFYSSTSSDQRLFQINSINGNLIWDVPDLPGFYSVAIKIEEWKKIGEEYQMAGYTIIDYLIQVIEEDVPKIQVAEIDLSCTASGDAYQHTLEIDNPDEGSLGIDVETQLSALRINDLPVDEWVAAYSEEVFKEPKITLALSISENETANFEGVNNVIFKLSAQTAPTNQKIVYSFNNQVNIGCRDEWLITSTPAEIENEIIQMAEGKLILYQEREPITLKILDLSGKILKSSYIEATNQKRKLAIDYPFSPNTVYIIFAESRAKSESKKFLITE